MRFTLRGLAVSMVVLAWAGACDGPSTGQIEQPALASLASESTPAAAIDRALVRADPPRRAASDPTPTTPYDRKAWKHWIDEDNDCQDARTEVLIAEAIDGLELEGPRGCEVEAGRWQCPYTGEIIREAHLLDVDHMVPLGNAHRSGAHAWDDARRQAYANDLDHKDHLVAVDFSANRSKGDKGPEAWLPPAEESRCNYVRDWVAIKARWSLSMTDAESAAVAAALAACEAGEIPRLPAPTKKAKKDETPREVAPKAEPPNADGECCRVCKKGKACGDGCISQESSCTKDPGCACDG